MRKVSLTFVLLAFFVGCGTPPKTLEKIHVAYVPYAADLPFFIAEKNGYFEKRGLKVVGIKCRNSSEAFDHLLAGRVQGSMGNSFSIIFTVHLQDENRICLINVSNETNENYAAALLVRQDDQIDKLEDLRNKRIGVYRGASGIMWLKLILRNKGLEPNADLTIEQDDHTLLLEGLIRKTYDAVYVAEPYATVGKIRHRAKEVGKFLRGEIMNPLPAGGAVLLKSFIQDFKGQASEFIDAIDEAIRFIKLNPERSKEILREYAEMEEDIAKKIKIYEWQSSNKVDKISITNLVNLFKDQGIIEYNVNVSSLFYSPKRQDRGKN